MKSLVSISLFIIIISCNGNEDKKSSSDSQTKSTSEVNKSANVNLLIKDKNLEDFEKLYIYKDSINNVNQKLGVTWLSKDSIEFILTSVNDLCEYKVTGIAINKYPNMDPEVDEASNEVSYPAIEYTVIGVEQLHSIKIEMLDRDLAKIKYKYSNPRDECDPESDVVMEIDQATSNRSSNQNDKVSNINLLIKSIDTDTTLRIKTYDASKVYGHAFDGGGSIEIHLRGKEIVKINQEMGLSFGRVSVIAYLQNSEPILIIDKEEDFEWIEKESKFNYQKLLKVFETKIYLDKWETIKTFNEGKRVLSEETRSNLEFEDLIKKAKELIKK